VADHYATWLELASAGQFEGQGERRTPKRHGTCRHTPVSTSGAMPTPNPTRADRFSSRNTV
jgi:hypothetical protein